MQSAVTDCGAFANVSFSPPRNELAVYEQRREVSKYVLLDCRSRSHGVGLPRFPAASKLDYGMEWTAVSKPDCGEGWTAARMSM